MSTTGSLRTGRMRRLGALPVVELLVLIEAMCAAVLAGLSPGPVRPADRLAPEWPALLVRLLPAGPVPTVVTIGEVVASALVPVLMGLLDTAGALGGHGIRETRPVRSRSAYALECAHKTMVAHDGRRPSSYRMRLGDISEDRSARDRGGRTAAHGV